MINKKHPKVIRISADLFLYDFNEIDPEHPELREIDHLPLDANVDLDNIQLDEGSYFAPIIRQYEVDGAEVTEEIGEAVITLDFDMAREIFASCN